MTNIAFLFTGIGNLSGGGGAERFFSDFFDQYQKTASPYNLFFITDSDSLFNLSEAGQLKNRTNVLTFRTFNNRFKNWLEGWQLRTIIRSKKIKLIQIPLYNKYQYPLMKAIDDMGRRRPKLVYTVTDAFIPHFYFDDQSRGYNFKNYLDGLFRSVNIDSVISWYELFKTFAKEHRIIKSNPPVYCIQSRYSGKVFNTSVPKQNHIVLVSRLTIAKQPMLFVEAVKLLRERNVDISAWKFFIYGKGNQEDDIRSYIRSHGLQDIITLSHTPDVTKVLEQSKCFVSTQAYENFPSLAMNEAMAAGNAIIARNVGQTGLFVKDGVNGLLTKTEDAQGFADAIAYYIRHPEQHEAMQQQSIRLTKEVHTFENFKIQMEEFWLKTLAPESYYQV